MISFSYYLFQVFRGSGNVWSAIEQSKKFGVIDTDSDSAHVITKKKNILKMICISKSVTSNSFKFIQALEHDDVVVLQVPVFKVVEAFNEIREKQSDKNSAN